MCRAVRGGFGYAGVHRAGRLQLGIWRAAAAAGGLLHHVVLRQTWRELAVYKACQTLSQQCIFGQPPPLLQLLLGLLTTLLQPAAAALSCVLQTITHMIDDVLADCMLHKAVQSGDIAFMELSRRTGEPVCVARKPGEPLELTEAEEGGPLEEFTVVRAGHDCGVNGEVLLQHVADGGGSRVGGGGGAAGGEGSKPAWVLATGGLEDLDGSSN